MAERILGTLTKLKGDNYHDWKFAVSMALRAKGCWEVVSGLMPKPESGGKEEWAKKAEEGLTIIGLTVEPTEYTYIRDCANGAEAWQALKDTYEKNTRATRISLKRQFYGFTHDTTAPIAHYVNGITDLAAKLKGIGIALTDEEITDVLIFNLDNEYSNIAASLMAAKGELKVSDVTSTLIEEARRKGEPSADPGITLMGREGPKGVRRRETRDCYRCGRPGHLMKDCRAVRDNEGKHISTKMEKEAVDWQKFKNSEQSAFAYGSLNEISY